MQRSSINSDRSREARKRGKRRARRRSDFPTFLSRVRLFPFNRDIPDYLDPVHLSLPPFFPSSPIIRLSRVASFLSLSTCLFFLFYVTRQSHWESSKKQRLSGQICLVYSDQRGYPSRVHTWLGIASSIGRAQHRSCPGTIVQSTHTIAEFTLRAQGYACSWASDEDPRLLSYLLRTRRFRLSRISRNGNRRWCYPVSYPSLRGVCARCNFCNGSFTNGTFVFKIRARSEKVSLSRNPPAFVANLEIHCPRASENKFNIKAGSETIRRN